MHELKNIRESHATDAVGEAARPREDVVPLERIVRVAGGLHDRGYLPLIGPGGS